MNAFQVLIALSFVAMTFAYHEPPCNQSKHEVDMEVPSSNCAEHNCEWNNSRPRRCKRNTVHLCVCPDGMCRNTEDRCVTELQSNHASNSKIQRIHPRR
uniref:TIL domain containing protein n=1 Tax=Rhipicephalus appendiculatus TaxID=34631 RepID=A0A131YUI1_RHIAP